MIEIELPFPDRLLSPNCSKRHWTQKHEAVVDAREIAAWTAINYKGTFGGEALHAWITFYPPDRKRRDLDNLLAAMKSSLDGICIGLGIDDRQIRRITIDWGAVEKQGKTVVRLEQLK